MAENEQKHRHIMNESDQPVRHRHIRIAQLYSLIVGLSGLIIAAILALYGHDVVAGIMVAITIGCILASFIINSRTQE